MERELYKKTYMYKQTNIRFIFFCVKVPVQRRTTTSTRKGEDCNLCSARKLTKINDHMKRKHPDEYQAQRKQSKHVSSTIFCGCSSVCPLLSQYLKNHVCMRVTFTHGIIIVCIYQEETICTKCADVLLIKEYRYDLKV